MDSAGRSLHEAVTAVHAGVSQESGAALYSLFEICPVSLCVFVSSETGGWKQL